MLARLNAVATLVALLLLAPACGGGTSTRPRSASSGEAATSVEALSYRLDGLADDDASRAALRAELVARVAASTPRGASLETLERSVAELTQHFRPEEMVAGGLPAPLTELARRLLDAATARGHSADALGAYCLLRIAQPDDAALRDSEARVLQWVVEGRASAAEDDPAASISAFQDAVDDARVLAVRLCPTRAALAAADRVIVDGARPILDRAEPRLRQVKARVRLTVVLTVAAVHLMAGDLHGLGAALPRSIAPTESDVFEELLGEALAPSRRGADGLVELGDSVARIGSEPFVGVMRIGRRLHPDDPRFPLALAHVARERGDALAALVAYEDTARLADQGPTHELAMRELLELGESLVDDEDERAIPVAASLVALRDELQRRSSERAASLPVDRLLRVEVGADLLAGDSERALSALRRGVSPEMRIALAIALAELDRPDDALATLNALAAPGSVGAPDVERHRGQIDRIRGDVLRTLGRTQESGDAYAETVAIFRRAEASPPSALAELALALARSGELDAAMDVFTDLFDADPSAAAAYVDLVELSMSVPVPSDVLDESIHHAIVHGALRPETLTLLAALVRLHSAESEDALPAVRQALHRGVALDGFASDVAGFALGTTSAEALLASASTPGRRASAHLLLALAAERAGDAARRRAELETAVSFGVFTETSHAVARELLSGRPATVSRPSAR